tara:strand:- start:307 stop:456 length:150 start_codon:yes stop_codon:yes gene_type:complete
MIKILLETLIYVTAVLKLRHLEEATDQQVEETLGMSKAIIQQITEGKKQ